MPADERESVVYVHIHGSSREEPLLGRPWNHFLSHSINPNMNVSWYVSHSLLPDKIGYSLDDCGPFDPAVLLSELVLNGCTRPGPPRCFMCDRTIKGILLVKHLDGTPEDSNWWCKHYMLRTDTAHNQILIQDLHPSSLMAPWQPQPAQTELAYIDMQTFLNPDV